VTFKVRFSERAVRDLHALPRDLQLRVVAKLEEAAGDPARFFRRLAGARTYRLRVGEHRVLADIDAKGRAIKVSHIGHRKNVYD
jgi:mRNA interferase RelE/StbE